MNEKNSVRRYLSLWLPFLTADRWRRDCADLVVPAGSDQSVVFINKIQGASRLVSVNRAAKAQGLLPGLSLADARTHVPMLKAVTYDAHADAVLLDKLADASLAFTPTVALDEPHGLALDITGCAHLFGDEVGMVAKFRAMLCVHGLPISRVAVAPTPDMARALARFGGKSSIFVCDDCDVRALPVTALECKIEDVRALRRAGLKTIGDVADRPSVLLTARFTQTFTTRLARILGEEDRRITPRRTPPFYQFEQRCSEPVANTHVVERVILDLAQHMASQLEARGDGGRVFELVFFRSDGMVRRIRVETSQPTRDPMVVGRLYRDRLDALADPLDPGFGFDLIQLHVLRVEPFRLAQTTLDASDEGQEGLGRLIDRLSAMFGRERIARLHSVNTHIPERSQMTKPAADKAAPTWWSAQQSETEMIRPLHLFMPPQPIEMAENSTESEPKRFRWRRVMHDVVYAEGPERIADEWWRASPGFSMRDYFRVETVDGRRFWIFRTAVTRDHRPQWFLHGVFP
jgi:protein ImuB